MAPAWFSSPSQIAPSSPKATPSWLIFPNHTSSVDAPVTGSTCHIEPLTPSSSPMSRTPDGAYHLTGSRRFQSARCAKIFFWPVWRSSFVTAPFELVSETVNRNRPVEGDHVVLARHCRLGRERVRPRRRRVASLHDRRRDRARGPFDSRLRAGLGPIRQWDEPELVRQAVLALGSGCRRHRRRQRQRTQDRKSTRLNSSHITNSYAVFCLKKKNI